MKALRIFGGLFFLVFGLGLALSLLKHLAHPSEPRHAAHLMTTFGLLVLAGGLAWNLLSNAFSDSVVAPPGGVAQVFGMAQLDSLPDRLTLRPAPKTRLNNLLMYGSGLLIFGVALPVNLRHHQWGWFAFSLAMIVFDLFMATFTLLRWRDHCIWDRAADLFLRNGSPVRPLSQIVGVEIEKQQNIHRIVLVGVDGSRIPAAPTLAVFGKLEDAEQFRQTLLAFLELSPPPIPVWPPPPTAPMMA